MALDFSAVLEDVAQEPEVVEVGVPVKLDAQALRAQLAKYEKELDILVDSANDLDVKDDASRAEGVNLAAFAKNIGKKIEEWHKVKKAPYLEAGKTIDNLKNLFAEKCTKIINIVKGKDRSYQAHLDMENARLKREQDEANRKIQEAVNAKAKEMGVEAPKVEVPVFVPLPQAAKTEAGSISYRDVWKWEVVDLKKVDRKYLCLNDKLINQDVKGGLREAPGLRIWLDKEPVLR